MTDLEAATAAVARLTAAVEALTAETGALAKRLFLVEAQQKTDDGRIDAAMREAAQAASKADIAAAGAERARDFARRANDAAGALAAELKKRK